MTNRTVFTGAATAIITPLTPEGIDFQRYGAMIDWQIEQGIDAIVAVGTTGEGSTLSDEEHRAAIKFCVERVAGRVPVIAGTGSNDTAYSVELSRYAASVGADAMLLVTPYYNKATQKGMYACSVAVADAIDKPCILYNVPGRTGCNMLPKTVAALAEHPNIVAIKEATGSMSQMVEIMALCGDKIDVYSGEDALTVAMMSMGGAGTISVLSNVAPAQCVAMTDAAKAGDFKTAANWQCKLLPLTNALFSQVNPIPVKAAVSAMGYGEENLRMPLTPMEEPFRSAMFEEMRKLGINV